MRAGCLLATSPTTKKVVFMPFSRRKWRYFSVIGSIRCGYFSPPWTWYRMSSKSMLKRYVACMDTGQIFFCKILNLLQAGRGLLNIQYEPIEQELKSHDDGNKPKSQCPQDDGLRVKQRFIPCDQPNHEAC